MVALELVLRARSVMGSLVGTLVSSRVGIATCLVLGRLIIEIETDLKLTCFTVRVRGRGIVWFVGLQRNRDRLTDYLLH